MRAHQSRRTHPLALLGAAKRSARGPTTLGAGRGTRLPLLLLAAALLATPWALAQPPKAETCTRASLSSPLAWATSGIWVGGHQAAAEILVADPLKEQVRGISRDGEVSSRLAGQVPTVEGESLPIGRIFQVRAAGDRYFFEDHRNKLILELNSDLEQVAQVEVSTRDASGRHRLDTIWDWSPLGSGFLAFGDIVEEKTNRWFSAFLYFDREGLKRIFHTVPLDSDAREFYVNNRFTASLGDTGYFLTLEGQPRLHAVDASSEKVADLALVPAEFSRWPQLGLEPEWLKVKEDGPRRNTAFYRVLERSSMPVALHAQGGLYLLARERPAGQGSTAWWLLQLDAASGRELGRVRLPTEAAHLTVVPGASWAFIEKGPVEGIGPRYAPYMKTDSMLLVPGGWMAELRGSPLGTPAVSCAEPQLRARLGG